MEGDCCIRFFFISIFVFQSTPSAWRETWQKLTSQVIAIYFNPLPPHGGRPNLRCTARNMRAFQSTPSAWRETGLPTHVVVCYGISIHSLRMEGDVCPELSHPGQTHYFNPLPPHGGRPNVHKIYFNVRYFNPLPPHGGRQSWGDGYDAASDISIHSLRMEGDPMFFFVPETKVVFQSTPSAWRETSELSQP